MADVMVTLASAQARFGRLVQFEQPRRSLMLSYPPVRSMMREFRFEAYQRDACVDGAPWRKPLLVITPTVKVGVALSATCPGGHEHIILRGPAPQGVPWTRVAAPYWPAWCRAIVRAWNPTLQQELDGHAFEQAGRPSLLLNQSTAMDVAFHESSFQPSGHRSGDQLAAVVSTGRQPSRGALPQLLPDGLPPEVHLQAALSIRHPYSAVPSATVAVKYAANLPCMTLWH